LDIWNIIPLEKLFFNTYFVIFLTLIINICIAIPASYALSSLDFFGKKMVILLALISQMFIPVLIIVPIFEIIKVIGLIDTSLGLVLVNSAFSIAFVSLLLKGFFEKIPKEIEEAALNDGCNRFSTLFRIYIPISKAGIVVTAIYNAILVNNEFLFANTLIMSDKKNMMIVALFKLIKSNPYAWEITMNHVMTAAILAALPIQIMFLLIRRHLTKGLLSGAIK
jgi:ABC-type glycerol-3-phosphate transport system permease component